MIFTLEYFIGLILIGVVAGFASGLLGVGGGFLIVPFQYFLLEYLGVDPSLAMMISLGTSLAIIIPTATSGASRHLKVMDNILKPGIRLGLFGIVGGYIGRSDCINAADTNIKNHIWMFIVVYSYS